MHVPRASVVFYGPGPCSPIAIFSAVFALLVPRLFAGCLFFSIGSYGRLRSLQVLRPPKLGGLSLVMVLLTWVLLVSDWYRPLFPWCQLPRMFPHMECWLADGVSLHNCTESPIGYCVLTLRPIIYTDLRHPFFLHFCVYNACIIALL